MTDSDRRGRTGRKVTGACTLIVSLTLAVMKSFFTTHSLHAYFTPLPLLPCMRRDMRGCFTLFPLHAILQAALGAWWPLLAFYTPCFARLPALAKHTSAMAWPCCMPPYLLSFPHSNCCVPISCILCLGRMCVILYHSSNFACCLTFSLDLF